MSALRRYQPLRPSRGTVIPESVKAEVRARDKLCVAFQLAIPHQCTPYRTEYDHVRSSGAIGKKSRSTADNIVLLCPNSHALKTLNGRAWRPQLLAWIAKFEVPSDAA